MTAIIRTLAVIGVAWGLLCIGIGFASGANVPVVVVALTAADLVLLSFLRRRS
jgi:hypothetical protein